MDPETLKKLGLPPGASAEEVHQRIDDLGADAYERDQLSKKLDASNAAIAILKAEREAETQAALAAERAAIDLDARSRGIWEPGSARQKHFEGLDLQTAKDFVALLEPQNPVGGGQQATPANMAPPAADGSLEALFQAEYGVKDGTMSVYTNAMAQLGLTAEQVAEFGPEAVWKKKQLHRDDDWSKQLRGENG